MMSKIRLDQIAARLGHDVPVKSSLPMPKPGEVYWGQFGQKERDSIDFAKTRPVLILGLAADTPAYNLVPLVHVIPTTTQFRDYRHTYRLALDGRDTNLNAANMTSIPIRKLGRQITRLSQDDFRRICKMMSEYFCISSEHSQDPILRRGDIYPVTHLPERFKGSQNLALIVSKSVGGLNTPAHAMPLTLHLCEDGISAMVNGIQMHVDTAQIRKVRPSLLDPISVGAIGADTLSRLDRVVAHRVNLR